MEVVPCLRLSFDLSLVGNRHQYTNLQSILVPRKKKILSLEKKFRHESFALQLTPICLFVITAID